MEATPARLLSCALLKVMLWANLPAVLWPYQPNARGGLYRIGPGNSAMTRSFRYDFHAVGTIGYRVGTILLIQNHYLLTYLLSILSLVTTVPTVTTVFHKLIFYLRKLSSNFQAVTMVTWVLSAYCHRLTVTTGGLPPLFSWVRSSFTYHPRGFTPFILI